MHIGHRTLRPELQDNLPQPPPLLVSALAISFCLLRLMVSFMEVFLKPGPSCGLEYEAQSWGPACVFHQMLRARAEGSTAWSVCGDVVIAADLVSVCHGSFPSTAPGDGSPLPSVMLSECRKQAHAFWGFGLGLGDLA